MAWSLLPREYLVAASSGGGDILLHERRNKGQESFFPKLNLFIRVFISLMRTQPICLSHLTRPSTLIVLNMLSFNMNFGRDTNAMTTIHGYLKNLFVRTTCITAVVEKVWGCEDI